MKKEIGQLVKHGGIYGLGTVMSKPVGFLMIPVYTHYLAPADYGVLKMLDITLFFNGLYARMGTGDAGRVVNPDDTAEIKEVLAGILTRGQNGDLPGPPSRDFVDQFRWDRLTQQLVEVFESVLDHGAKN